MWTIDKLKKELPEVNIKIGRILVPAMIRDAGDGFCCVYNINLAFEYRNINGFAISVSWETVLHNMNRDEPILS